MENKNIIDIHNSIIQTFDREEKILPLMKDRIQELYTILHDSTTSQRLKNEIYTEIEELETRIKKIESKEELHFYILKITPILEKYKKELNKPVEVNFMGEKIPVDNSILNTIYNEFMRLIQSINPIYYCIEQKDSRACTNCNNINEKIIESTNTIACAHCGTEQESMKFTFSYKDTDRINIATKYTYDRRLHFKECINQFQGKQNSTIKPDVYSKLITQLVTHGLVSEDTTIPQEIRFKNVTKNHILLFLKEINCAHHYEDLNLIYHNITGKPLDDISHLENTLMNDFDKLSKLYDEEYIKTKKISRKNFINTQYVLYQLLRRHKYPCVKNDFTFLKTIERKSFHDEVCSDLFKKLGWNFTCVF
jgi:hypothetical protein